MPEYTHKHRAQQTQLKVKKETEKYGMCRTREEDSERSKKLLEAGKSLTLYYGQYLRTLEACEIEDCKDSPKQRQQYKEFCEKFGYNYENNILQEVCKDV